MTLIISLSEGVFHLSDNTGEVFDEVADVCTYARKQMDKTMS